MEGVAQLVRASGCGSEGRGFESHHPPQKCADAHLRIEKKNGELRK